MPEVVVRGKAYPLRQPSVEPTQLYEVWAEGHRATGDSSEASLMGEARAATFKEACKLVMQRTGRFSYYDEEHNDYWGCKLFDNEADARRSFG